MLRIDHWGIRRQGLQLERQKALLVSKVSIQQAFPLVITIFSTFCAKVFKFSFCFLYQISFFSITVISFLTMANCFLLAFRKFLINFHLPILPP